MNPPRIGAVGACLVILYVHSPQALSADKTWVCDAAVTYWYQGDCWSPSGEPADGDSVQLTSSAIVNSDYVYGIEVNYGTTLIPAATLDSLTIENTNPAAKPIELWQAHDNLQTLTEIVGDTGRGNVDLSGGTHTVNGSWGLGYALTLGNAAGSEGRFTVAGTGQLSAQGVEVGYGGQGTMEVAGGGTASAGRLRLGYEAGGQGAVIVRGAGSSFDTGRYAQVGVSGTGEFNVENGGTVHSGQVWVGYQAGSTGAVTVTGAGSFWAIDADLQVGQAGNGTLGIYAGARVTSRDGIIGYVDGVTGGVSVDASTWHVVGSSPYGAIEVGVVGTGTLKVSNGSLVTSNYGRVGLYATGRGEVTVDGVGSSWTMNRDLQVARADGARGDVTISGGGSVAAGSYLTLAQKAGAIANVVVAGAGSTLSTGDRLVVGGDYAHNAGGNGNLAVENGGAVNVGTDMALASPASVVRVSQGSTIGVAGDYVQNDGLTALDGIISATNIDIHGGTVQGSGTFVGNVNNYAGIWLPGNSPGTLTVDGDYTQAAGAILNMQVSGLDAGMFDQLVVTGTASFEAGTTINFDFTDYTPTQDDAFDFLVADTTSLDLAVVNFTYSGLEDGFQFETSQSGGQLTFTALNDAVAAPSSVPLPAGAWLLGSGLLGLGSLRRKSA